MTSALFDSVFGVFRYSDAPDLMPIDEIIGSMNTIEFATLKAMNDATRSAVKRLKKEAQGKSLSEISKLNWDLAPDIAETLNVTWDKGYKTGSRDAIKEMKAAIPLNKTNVFDFKHLKPFSAFDSGRPKASVKAILSRNLKIAGDYSKEILERVKNNLSQSMITQPDTGYPMPPKQVNALIQDTLNVSQSRAATISRTETTNAYSESRVETFKQSSLATHCRFLAIADDRVTDICKTRNGIVFPISEESKYRPALHFNCRSTISVLLPRINPQHQKMIDDPNLDPNNRVLAPLLVGWR